MTIQGQVVNGQIVWSLPVDLPDGTTFKVEVTPALEKVKEPEDKKPLKISHAELFAKFIGIAEGLPSDCALNHDHYLYGVEKR